MDRQTIKQLAEYICEMRCKAVSPFNSGNPESIYGKEYTDLQAARDIGMLIDCYREGKIEVKAFYTPRRQATEKGLQRLRHEDAPSWLIKALRKEHPNYDLRIIREATSTLLAAFKDAGIVARLEIQKRMQQRFNYRSAIMPDPLAALVEYLHGLEACAQEISSCPVAINPDETTHTPAQELAQDMVCLLRGHIGRVPQRSEMEQIARLTGEKLGWAHEAIRAAYKELWIAEFSRWFHQERIVPDKVPEADRGALLEKAVQAICLLDGGTRTREAQNTYPKQAEIDKVYRFFWCPMGEQHTDQK